MELKKNFQEQSLLWLSDESYYEEDQEDHLNYDCQFDLYLKCPMEYRMYPFDVHTCSIKWSSADLDATRLKFNISDPAKWGKHKNTIGYFDVDILPLDAFIEMFDDEPWSMTGFKLTFRRKYRKYIINYYLSSGLFVIISWVSFLVPAEDINARIALLITTLLVLVTVFNGVIEMSPKADNGQTSLDVWMFSMLVFILLAFILASTTSPT